MSTFDPRQRRAAIADRLDDIVANAETVTVTHPAGPAIARKLGLLPDQCTRDGCGHDQEGHTRRWGPEANRTAAVGNCRLCNCAVYAPPPAPADGIG